MKKTIPTQEEIKKREFAYRAYSPDSEPPLPIHRTETKNKTTEKSNPQGATPPENGRQSA